MIQYINSRVGGGWVRFLEVVGDREHLITKVKPEEKILR